MNRYSEIQKQNVKTIESKYQSINEKGSLGNGMDRSEEAEGPLLHFYVR